MTIILPKSVVDRDRAEKQAAIDERLSKIPLLGFDPRSLEYGKIRDGLQDVFDAVTLRFAPPNERLEKARKVAVIHLAMILLGDDIEFWEH